MAYLQIRTETPGATAAARPMGAAPGYDVNCSIKADDRLGTASYFRVKQTTRMSESRQFQAPKPAPTAAQRESLARIEHTLSTATVEGLLRSTARLSATLDTTQLLDWLVDDALTLVGAESGYAGVRKDTALVSHSFRRQREAVPFERTFLPDQGLPGWL